MIWSSRLFTVRPTLARSLEPVAGAGVEHRPRAQAPAASGVGNAAVAHREERRGELCVVPGQAGVEFAAPVVGVEAVALVLAGVVVGLLVVVGQHQGVAEGRGEGAVVTGAPADVAAQVDAAGALLGRVDGIDVDLVQAIRVDAGVAGVAFDPRQGVAALRRVRIEPAATAGRLVAQQFVRIEGGQQVIDLDVVVVGGKVEPARRRPDEAVAPVAPALGLQVGRAALHVVDPAVLAGAVDAFLATVVVLLRRVVAVGVGLVDVVQVRRAEAGAVAAA